MIKKLKVFAHKRKVQHKSTVMETSIFFHTVVKLVVAEDFKNENLHAAQLPWEINDVAPKLEKKTFFYEKSEPKSAIMFTKTADATNESKNQFRKYCSFCKKSNHCFKILSKTMRS